MTVMYVRAWQTIPGTMPVFDRRFTPDEQRENELLTTRKLKSIPRSSGEYASLTDHEKAHLSLDILNSLGGASLSSRGVHPDHFFDDSEKVTKQFVADATAFDPALSESDLHQALRNLWVFNSIQMMLGTSVRLTPSSFAYSLLYPYVDNGFDGAGRSDDDKCGLASWLGMWFKESGCAPVDELTAKIDRLLRMIEREFPSTEFGDVHQSLLAILSGQRKSLALHGDCSSTDDDMLTSITVEKGGTSVLADGYLATGTLNHREADALFGYGVALQLIDDLQDLEEDGAACQATPFQRLAERGEAENAAMRLLRLCKRCAEDLGKLCSNNRLAVRKMIYESCSFLILDAVEQHHCFYSKAFLNLITPGLPFRAGYLRELRTEMKTVRSRDTRAAAAKSPRSYPNGEILLLAS